MELDGSYSYHGISRELIMSIVEIDSKQHKAIGQRATSSVMHMCDENHRFEAKRIVLDPLPRSILQIRLIIRSKCYDAE